MVEKVYEDWRTAPVREEVRAALGFLEELALRPNELGPEHIRPMRDAGVGEDAIEQVSAIGSLFAIIVRIADSLAFAVPSEEEFARLAPRMLSGRYR